MRHLFQCPQCGYRNYVTREDLDAEKAARVDKIAKRLADPERGAPLKKFVGRLNRLFRNH